MIDAVTIDGAFSELFDIQDRVAAQVRESLAAGTGRAAVQPAPVPPARAPGPDTLEPPARAGPNDRHSEIRARSDGRASGARTRRSHGRASGTRADGRASGSRARWAHGRTSRARRPCRGARGPIRPPSAGGAGRFQLRDRGSRRDNRRTASSGRPGGRRPRRSRARHRPCRQAQRTLAGGRCARRRHLRDRPLHRRLRAAAPDRGRAHHGAHRGVGLLRRRERLRGGAAVVRGARVAVDRQRDAARLVPDHQQRLFQRRHRHLLRPAQRLRVHDHAHRRLLRLRDHRRGQPQQRLESDLEFEHGPFRGRLDRGDGDPVQVAPVPARPEPGLGPAARTPHPLQERDHLSDHRPHLGRPRHVPTVGGRHPGRRRGPERQPPVRGQAVRHRLGQRHPRIRPSSS